MPKFKKGQSGNPAGKKIGTQNKRTQLAKMLDPHAEGLINKTVELALSGDTQALKLCIERLIPKANNHSIQFDIGLENLECNDNLSSVGRRIITSIAEGHLSPEDGQKLFNMLDNQRRLIEHVDLVKKLEELKEYLPNNRF